MAIASRVRKRDGRRVYDVRLRDPSGHVYTRTFETKRQAQAFETTEKADRARGGWIDPRRATTHFEDVAAAWLHSSPNKRDSALARDTSVLTYHLLPAFQGRPIGSIVRGDVEGLVTAWIGKQPPATVVRQYATLRAIFNYAVTSELIARSPCRGVRLPQAHPRRAKILTSEELQRLAASMGDYALMPYLAVVLPLRWGEIAGLRVGSIDFLRQTIAVTRQRTRGTKGRMIEEDPKSEAGKRTLAVSDWLMTLLADHLATRGVTGAESDALTNPFSHPTVTRCTIRTGDREYGSLPPRRPTSSA